MLAIHNTHHAPPTPPYTSTFLSRTTTTLPPITHLDRIQPPHKLTLLHGDRVSTQRPVTPPEEDMLPGKPTVPSDAPHLVDWLDFTRSRSAHFIAEKTCEMICYLWHATPSTPPEAHISSLSDSNAYPSPKNSPPTSALTHTSHPSPPTSYQQLVVTPAFVSFVQKILETTQVSQSVIVLSLHYIYKLKEKTSLVGPPGSEFRIAVAALMMANKFLDDNTYTNKTWSEVSGIELLEVNKMEKEFLTGVEYNLYVDKPTYEAWLNLLKGLVMAKERDLSRARERRRQKRRLAGAVAHGQAHTPGGRLRYFRTVGSGPYVPSQPNRQPVQRARSTSPVSRSSFHSQPPPQPVFHRLPPIQTQPPPCFSNASPPYSQQSNSQTSYNYKPASYSYSPSPAPSSLKRSAATAFSPTSASFSHVPTKRTGVTSTDSLPSIATSGFASLATDQASNHTSHQRPGITLQIPQEQRPAPHSYSPMDNLPLQGFANMNLDSTSSVPSTASFTSTSNSLSSALGPMPIERECLGETRERKQHMRMSTLVQPYAYSADDQRRGVPKHLYFYTLACSPLENTPSGLSKAPSPAYPQQQEDYDMEREAVLQRERELERERERALERQRELDIEREKEREMERERQRKARLRVHRPAPVSSIRYSDYAYMPYVSSTGVTGHPMNGIHPSYLPSSTAHGSSAASTVVPRQSQSVRTSPVVNTGRHFDAVRFEVERTQGYAPASSGQYEQQRQPPSQQAPRPQSQSQQYYSSPSVAVPHTSGVRKPQGHNPYPQLSPPTPATSTSTSPVTLAPPPPRTTCANNAAAHIDHHGSPFNGTTYANLGHGPSPPSYSSLAGATTYGRNTYERCCVSAYTSPAMDLRGYSPQNHYSDQGVPLMNGSSVHRFGAADSASAREELAYAQAQAQHQKYLSQQQQQQPQQRGTYDNSPGVPTAPFANAGPPGVHHMQYYSESQSHTAGSTNGVGGRGYGYSGYGASNMNAYGR